MKRLALPLFRFLLFLFLFPCGQITSQSTDTLGQQPYFIIPDSINQFQDRKIYRGLFVTLPAVWILEDSTGKLGIEDVISTEYANSFRKEKSFAYTPTPGSTTWLRIRLQGAPNASLSSYFLAVSRIYQSIYYEKLENGQMAIQKNGFQYWPWEKTHVLREFNFGKYNLVTDQKREIFIRMERKGLLRVKYWDKGARLYTYIIAEQAWERFGRINARMDFFFGGLFFCLIVLFLILGRFVKDSYLGLYSLAIFFFWLVTDKDICGMLFPDLLSIWINKWFTYAVQGTFFIFLAKYSYKKINYPLLIRIFYYWALFLFGFVFVQTIADFTLSSYTYESLALTYRKIRNTIQDTSFYGSIVLGLIGCSILILKKQEGRKLMLFFLIIFLLFTGTVNILRAAGIVMPSLYYRIGTRFIVAAMSIGFAQSIGKQYVGILKEKNKATKEKLVLQQNLNRELEIQVQNRTAELQQKNQLLLQLDQEKNNLINVVAHDLGSPLARIKMYSGIVEKAQDKLTSKQKEYLAGISSTAQRGVDMIRQILDINAVDHEGQKLNLREIDITPIIEESVKDFKELAKRKAIQIKVDLPASSIALNIDSNAFRQVIDNLVSNAIKFSPYGKEVTIGVHKIKIEPGEEKIKVFVRDQGPGISPEDASKLFQRYARLTAQPTGGESSTGLGLAIAHQYIEAMDGKIWHENNEREGATFWVEFSE